MSRQSDIVAASVFSSVFVKKQRQEIPAKALSEVREILETSSVQFCDELRTSVLPGFVFQSLTDQPPDGKPGAG
jgi:hypothetical protein